MWEVAGLLFLSTETKEKVETGIAFFREGLISAGVDVENPLIFFLDKDFDYIDVSFVDFQLIFQRFPFSRSLRHGFLDV